MSTNTPESPPRRFLWTYAFVGVYAVAGYFAGHEYSRVAGAALLALGLGIGWLVAATLATAPTKIKVVALAAPVGLAGLLAVLLTPATPHGQVVKRAALDGTWVSQGASSGFTVRLEGDSAWLSEASGLKNVAYQAAVHNDTLVLSADESNVLRWRIARDTTRHALVLVAGEGIYFLKTSPQ